jgi:hypothetical protein
MHEPTNNKRMLKVVVGFLFIGGLAAIFGIYRAAKNTDRPPFYV